MNGQHEKYKKFIGRNVFFFSLKKRKIKAKEDDRRDEER